MRLLIDSLNEHEKEMLKHILDEGQDSIEIETVIPYQVRRIIMILGQLEMAQKVDKEKKKA